LFAFPAQSNFSGVRHPLEWVHDAQKRGYRVLVDAAAYLPSTALSLQDVPADFVVLSYYKLFGYPTGVGALVARHEALAMLRRRYFAGGSVQFVSVQTIWFVSRRAPRHSKTAHRIFWRCPQCRRGCAGSRASMGQGFSACRGPHRNASRSTSSP
jgi:selenocysteine lyase/cysteine desulfurase